MEVSGGPADFRLLSPEFLHNPYRFYARLHDEGPVCWSSENGAFLVGAYQAARTVLADSATFSSSLRQDPRSTVYGGRIMIFSDPPLHTTLRRFWAPSLGRRALEHLQSVVSRETWSRVTRAFASEEFEVVQAIARPVPLVAICALLGLDVARWAELGEASDAIVSLSGGPEGSRRRRELAARLREAFHDHLREQTGGVECDDLDLRVAGMMLMLIAGHETTTSFLANLLLLLADEPWIVEEVGAGSANVASVVEEALRLVGPIKALRRVAVETGVIDGVEIPRGKTVIVLPGAANRDPSVFFDAATFRLDRDVAAAPALAFGFGIHQCLGSMLAKIEASALMMNVADVLAGRRLRRGTSAVEYVESVFVHGPRLLQMRIT